MPAAAQSARTTTATTATVPAPGGSIDTQGNVTHLLGPGLPSGDASQDVRGTNNHEVFRVLGFSGQIAAPVDSPYNAHNTYSTYAGQPGRGATAVMQATTPGSP